MGASTKLVDIVGSSCANPRVGDCITAIDHWSAKHSAIYRKPNNS